MASVARFILSLLLAWLAAGDSVPALAGQFTTQESLDEWRLLTSEAAPSPHVFVKRDTIRFYFPTPAGVELFSCDWDRVRVPAENYKVGSAILKRQSRVPAVPFTKLRGWREAVVIGGAEWRQLATNLYSALAPSVAGEGAYYQAFLADGVLYRDEQGHPHFAPVTQQPKNIRILRQYSVEETLEIVAELTDSYLSRTHPTNSLFLILAPNARRITHPLLLDRQHRRCVVLSPAALYEQGDFGLTMSYSAQSLEALLLESHGLALLRNPISSAARLADLGVATVIRFLRLRLPKLSNEIRELRESPGMDLVQWEHWLDTFTGTRPVDGSLRLRIDGERFFPRFTNSLATATNHIHLLVYMFDRDDVGVEIADLLKRRADEVDVKVILDRMGTLAAGSSPPGTPLPEHFMPPKSILSYLRSESKVKVRPFLNPWMSSEHSKLLLVDGRLAWLGGMNLGREYRYEWHDLMVEIQGPIVAEFEKDFRREWAHAGPWGDLGYMAALLTQRKVPSPRLPAGDWIKVRRLPTRTGWKPFATAVGGALRKAQNHIYVENPYLFDARTIAALARARERGVDVRVILPRVNDFKPGGRANLVVANYLFNHGVRVYFYPGMTHVKALLVDGWSCLGSANLNHLSLRVNQEQNVATSDPGFADRVRHEVFEEDFARSYELTEPISVEWGDFVTDLLLEGF